MNDAITNDHVKSADQARALDIRTDQDLPEPGTGRAHLAVKRYKYTDPDIAIDKMVHTVQTYFTDVDAKIQEVRQVRGRTQLREVHYRSLQEMMQAKPIRERVLNQLGGTELREIGQRLEHMARTDKDLNEARLRGKSRVDQYLSETGKKAAKRVRESDFYLGLYADEVQPYGTTQRSVFPLQDTILPSTTSPQSKQQLFMDYLDMHRKSWEAATRNPIGKRIVDIVPQFVLGRSFFAKIDSESHQKAWDSFWKFNKMRGRTRVLLRELLTYGEIFLHYFRLRDGLAVRSLDPSTIWDIVTNPEDIEDVYYYHQQYSTLNISPVAFQRAAVPSILVIRQIAADKVYHHKINAMSTEKRGRSQLYTILAWLLRFKEFANDRVLLNKMRAMFALDVAVEGGSDDLATAEAQFATPPGPGAILIHNKAIEVEFKNANNNANEAKTDAEMILKIIAIGSGVSEQFLGVSGASTRAGALIQTEPDVKNFETYQEIIEDILMDAWERISKEQRLPKTDKPLEIGFPSLAGEDRSAKLKDLALAEAMDWASKERTATMGMKELGVTSYKYAQEQERIREERGKDPVIATGMQQVPKIAPDPLAMAEEPGLGDDLAPGAGGQPAQPADPEGFTPTGGDKKVTQTSGQMGFSAKALSGRDLPNTKATLNRPGFTRGREKTAIRNNRTSGTPLRASGAGKPRHVWDDAARAKALETRRQNALRRAAVETPAPAPVTDDGPTED